MTMPGITDEIHSGPLNKAERVEHRLFFRGRRRFKWLRKQVVVWAGWLTGAVVGAAGLQKAVSELLIFFQGIPH